MDKGWNIQAGNTFYLRNQYKDSWTFKIKVKACYVERKKCHYLVVETEDGHLIWSAELDDTMKAPPCTSGNIKEACVRYTSNLQAYTPDMVVHLADAENPVMHTIMQSLGVSE